MMNVDPRFRGDDTGTYDPRIDINAYSTEDSCELS